MGRQAQLMLFNLTGFWAVGVTTGYVLTFRFNWGLSGLWYGILAGVLAAGMVSDPLTSRFPLPIALGLILPSASESSNSKEAAHAQI